MGKRGCCRLVQLCNNALRRSTNGACGKPAKVIFDGPTSCLISGSVSEENKTMRKWMNVEEVVEIFINHVST